MREAKIILPNLDNDGASLAPVHAALRRTLCEVFGGCTLIASEGAWFDSSTGKLYAEAGVTYFVAMMDTNENREKIQKIAARVARDARQICVYAVDAGGMVHFVEPAAVEA